MSAIVGNQECEDQPNPLQPLHSLESMPCGVFSACGPTYFGPFNSYGGVGLSYHKRPHFFTRLLVPLPILSCGWSPFVFAVVVSWCC